MKKNAQRKQKARRERYRKAHKETFTAKESAEIVLWQIKKVLHFHFPDLGQRINALAEPRKGADYSMEEMIMAAIVLFLLKCDSRNDFNNKSLDKQFYKNYTRIFHLRPPSMDAVNNLFEKLDPSELEQLRCRLINALIEKRVFHKFRFFKNFFCIGVDGTGTYNWGATPSDSIRPYALKKESKKETGDGKVNYSSQVLESVLICRNGMTIPLISEWIANDGEKYDKQDCELKAFKRLAERLKKYFPQLHICILADGLYSNVAMMNVCKEHEWKFITVFKDGNLPSVWEEVESLLPLSGAAQTAQTPSADATHWITCNYRWITDIEYQKHSIHWVECVRETTHRQTKEKNSHQFVFLSTLDLSLKQIESVVTAGRARWSIEDHFNTQKNRGGALHHKFNRNNFQALKNWHHIRQLACIISELVKYSRELQQLLKNNAKMTWKELWKNINAFLTMCSVDIFIVAFECWAKVHRQVRLE